MPSLYETFRDSRCYIWCCKELLNGMICLISSSEVAITSMTNFSCLLMFSFQYAVFFLNIFDTEVMAINVYFFFLGGGDLAKSHTFLLACSCQSIISSLLVTVACVKFFKKVSLRLPYLSLCLESRFSLYII